MNRILLIGLVLMMVGCAYHKPLSTPVYPHQRIDSFDKWWSDRCDNSKLRWIESPSLTPIRCSECAKYKSCREYTRYVEGW